MALTFFSFWPVWQGTFKITTEEMPSVTSSNNVLLCGHDSNSGCVVSEETAAVWACKRYQWKANINWSSPQQKVYSKRVKVFKLSTQISVSFYIVQILALFCVGPFACEEVVLLPWCINPCILLGVDPPQFFIYCRQARVRNAMKLIFPFIPFGVIYWQFWCMPSLVIYTFLVLTWDVPVLSSSLVF